MASTPTATATDVRAETALAWLAGSLRWERVLRDLGERAEHAGGPLTLGRDDLAVPAEHAERRAA